MLVGEAGGESSHRRHVEVVEETRDQCLCDQQIGLVVGPSEHVTRLRQGPSIEIAPRLEKAQHPVEATGKRLRASAHLTPQLIEISRDPLGLHG